MEDSCPTEPQEARSLDELTEVLLRDYPEWPKRINDQRWSLLHCAIHEEDEEAVTQILSVAPEMCNEEETYGFTALDLAVYERKEDMVLLILELCPQLIREVRYQGWTVLHDATHEDLIWWWTTSFVSIPKRAMCGQQTATPCCTGQLAWMDLRWWRAFLPPILT